jgi:hypothetical protein
MGGNALKYETVRLSKSDYVKMADECTLKLKSLYPDNHIQAIESYRSKETFGDLDILIESTGFDPFKAADILSAVQVVRNGPVTSIGLRINPNIVSNEKNVFQVDFIAIDKESFDYAKNYFAHNDQGNLVGRLFHATGLAHRHDGLYHYFRDGDYKFKETLLTKDYEKALEFMGYDSDKFKRGFDTLDDMFKFVGSSKFFNKSIFLLENRNAQSRVRDAKRPSYTAFLKWCEITNPLPDYTYPKDKNMWHDRIDNFFPGFHDKYNQAKVELEKLREVKNKFNGDIVSQWTGFSGKELGQIMASWKKSFESSQSMHTYILNNGQEILKNKVVEITSKISFKNDPEKVEKTNKIKLKM